MTATSRSLC